MTLLYPIDVVKTRVQNEKGKGAASSTSSSSTSTMSGTGGSSSSTSRNLGGSSSSSSYSFSSSSSSSSSTSQRTTSHRCTPGDSFPRRVYIALRSERLGVYRGIQFPLAVELPKRAWKFAFQGQCTGELRDKYGWGVYQSAFLAGGLTGATEAPIITTSELTKIRMQLPQYRDVYNKGLPNTLRHIVTHEGYAGLVRGLSCTMQRGFVWNSVFFSSTAWLRDKRLFKSGSSSS
ncbi:unnamed protein product, partial [Amoebophrya sp. A25]|eukprot:GSA25T00010040001.1